MYVNISSDVAHNVVRTKSVICFSTLIYDIEIIYRNSYTITMYTKILVDITIIHFTSP